MSSAAHKNAESADQRSSGVRVNALVIRTPEGIAFRLLLAGPIARFAAWGLDLACILTLTSIVVSLLGSFGVFGRDLAFGVMTLATFAVSMGYGMVMEWYWRGQTIGKRLFRLRVMDAQGLRLQFSQIVVRNLLRCVDTPLPFLSFVGGLSCVLTPRAQRLGDIAANTIVVYTPKVTAPDLEQLMGGKYNSFRAYPHLEARLRQRVDPQEARIALHALQRRDQLDAAARVELFGSIARRLRARVTFPDDALLSLTDEQYVRNVVNSLWRQAGE